MGTFCILPWMHVATNASGNLRVCCNSTPGKNVPRDTQGRPYRLVDSGAIEAYWNSDDLRTIRKQMLNNERPPICVRCFREEDAGVKSSREGWNEAYGHLVDEAIASTNEDGSAPLRAVYVDLRLGNLCNLRCRMCNPYASSQWVDEWESLNPGALSPEEAKRLSSMNWFESDAFVRALEPHLENIDQVYLTGGEPTLATGQYRLLERLIERGLAGQVILKYNTNVTNIPQKLLDYWPKFKKVRLNLSVDAMGELDRYIRYPSNWKAIDKNLKALDALGLEHRNLIMTVHTTVQAYNVTRMTDLLNYMLSFKSIRRFPYLNILNHPEWLNIRVLPIALKQEAAQKLRNWRDANGSTIEEQSYLAKLEQMIAYMEAEDWGHLLPMFFEKTDVMDTNREERLANVLPEIEAYRP